MNPQYDRLSQELDAVDAAQPDDAPPSPPTVTRGYRVIAARWREEQAAITARLKQRDVDARALVIEMKKALTAERRREKDRERQARRRAAEAKEKGRAIRPYRSFKEMTPEQIADHKREQKREIMRRYRNPLTAHPLFGKV